MVCNCIYCSIALSETTVSEHDSLSAEENPSLLVSNFTLSVCHSPSSCCSHRGLAIVMTSFGLFLSPLTCCHWLLLLLANRMPCNFQLRLSVVYWPYAITRLFYLDLRAILKVKQMQSSSRLGQIAHCPHKMLGWASWRHLSPYKRHTCEAFLPALLFLPFLIDLVFEFGHCHDWLTNVNSIIKHKFELITLTLGKL